MAVFLSEKNIIKAEKKILLTTTYSGRVIFTKTAKISRKRLKIDKNFQKTQYVVSILRLTTIYCDAII